MTGTVKTVEEFLDNLPPLHDKIEGNTFYRGQSEYENGLIPSVLRKSLHEKEYDIYMEIITECAHEFDRSMSHNEVLSKMQHYGVPTRLLDITTNALVALYFACDGNPDKDGAVFILKPDRSLIKSYDSDTVTILSCLPKFTKLEKEMIYNLCERYKNNNITKKQRQTFNKEDIIRRLLHEIKKEKPAFENIIDPNHLLKNYYLIPRKSNPRIIRQSGAFIIYGLGERERKFENEDTVGFYKIKIDSSSKNNIIQQLSCFGISKATLYIELYKVAENIKDKYKSYLE